MNKKVILIHGFFRGSNDMLALKTNLSKLGYAGMVVDLPLTFQRIEESVALLDNFLAEIIKSLGNDEKIYLVGHSTGGLVIRSWWAATKFRDKIAKCVLVATPNNGSELADMAGRYLKILPHFCKTLESLQSHNVKKYPLPSQLGVATGAIAGDKNNLLLGKLIKGENDGRVSVESVLIEGLEDFVILHYGHMEIHHQMVTAQLIDHFFKTGSFK